MNLSLFLFLIGILGFILNRKNLILMIISIEIMLLAVENLSLLSDLNLYSELQIASYATPMLIKPWQITGISDGDGNFSISIIRNKKKDGWLVIPSFNITCGLNPANLQMLSYINSFFGGIGHVSTNGNVYQLRFMGYKNCLIIRSHFIEYPLLTYKLTYFKLWEEVLDLMRKKEHLTASGLLKIVAIKFTFKKGIDSDLVSFFPDIQPVSPPSYQPSLHLMNNAWLTGFIIADGSFGIYLSKCSSYRQNFKVIPQIRITQDVISLLVLEAIKNMLGLGVLTKPSPNRSVATLAFNSKKAISLILCAICRDNPLHGSKLLDYLDFCKGYELFLKKDHLDPKGLEELINIVKGMNTVI